MKIEIKTDHKIFTVDNNYSFIIIELLQGSIYEGEFEISSHSYIVNVKGNKYKIPKEIVKEVSTFWKPMKWF